MWKLMLIAGAGGFIGTCCRFLVNRFFSGIVNYPSFPWATFFVNVTGCFLFGFIFGLLSKNGALSPKLNALLIVGFCGGFTTFSTFSNESFTLFNNGFPFISITYIAGSIVSGLLAVWLGFFISR